MLYDAPTNIGNPEYEHILQALIWVADFVVLPSYASASRTLPPDANRKVSRGLAALAEAGLIRRWRVDLPMPQVEPVSWWPAATQETVVDRSQCLTLQENVREGTARYRDDLMRGIGRRPGSMMSGITEFVQLQETLWIIGLSRVLGTDFLLSTQQRSSRIESPIMKADPVGSAVTPVSETIMQLHGIGPLANLRVRDLKRLRRRLPTVRQELTRIAIEADRELLTPTDSRRFSEAVTREARARYAEVMGTKVDDDAATARRSSVVGVGLTVAGTIYPPLSALGFAQPLLSWNPRHRKQHQFVLFLRKLRKVTKRRGEAMHR